MRYWLLTFVSHTVEYLRVPAMGLSPQGPTHTWLGTCRGWRLAGPQGRQGSEPIWFERGDKLYFRILPNVLELLWASVGQAHEQS